MVQSRVLRFASVKPSPPERYYLRTKSRIWWYRVIYCIILSSNDGGNFFAKKIREFPLFYLSNKWFFSLHSWTNNIIIIIDYVIIIVNILKFVCQFGDRFFFSFRTVGKDYLDHWNGAMPRWRGGYWLSRVLVTSEMDSKGLPVSGLESEGQLAPFPPLMIPPRVGAEGGGGGAEGGTRRCCCWCCCPARCPCRPLSPLFPQLTGACCNRNRAFPRYFHDPFPTPSLLHPSHSLHIPYVLLVLLLESSLQ